jgi:hypothetical protein
MANGDIITLAKMCSKNWCIEPNNLTAVTLDATTPLEMCQGDNMDLSFILITTRASVTIPGGSNTVLSATDIVMVPGYEYRFMSAASDGKWRLFQVIKNTYLTLSNDGMVTVPYSASITFDSSKGDYFVITATDTSSFAVNAPTNPITGKMITVRIKNPNVLALGTLTWDTVFKMGSVWTQPSTGNSRSIDFRYNGTNWVETNRSAADIAN